MKTPEETKKGLSEPELFCSHCQHHGEPHGCNRPNGSCQAFDNADDALDYIQRLEAQNAELVKKIERLQRERDAAVTDIHKTCSTCKHYYYNRQDDDAADCPWLDGCKIKDHWEWRGVPEKEDTE